MKNNAVSDSLVGFSNNGFGHTSDSQQNKREWNIVVDKINNADIDWLNGNVFTKIADAGKPVSAYLNKWHPSHGADQDLVDHFAASVVLKERVGGVLALTVGVAKEVMDIFTSSVGYSNDDLATDFAGALGYSASEALAAGLFNHTNSEYDSSDMGWVDNARKLMDLLNPDVIQSDIDHLEAAGLWKMTNGYDENSPIEHNLFAQTDDFDYIIDTPFDVSDAYIMPVDSNGYNTVAFWDLDAPIAAGFTYPGAIYITNEVFYTGALVEEIGMDGVTYGNNIHQETPGVTPSHKI